MSQKSDFCVGWNLVLRSRICEHFKNSFVEILQWLKIPLGVISFSVTPWLFGGFSSMSKKQQPNQIAKLYKPKLETDHVFAVAMTSRLRTKTQKNINHNNTSLYFSLSLAPLNSTTIPPPSSTTSIDPNPISHIHTASDQTSLPYSLHHLKNTLSHKQIYTPM